MVARSVLVVVLIALAIVVLFRSASFAMHQRILDKSSPVRVDVSPQWMLRASLTYNVQAIRELSAVVSPTRDNILHMTIGTSALADWVANWARHARSVGITPLIVGAIDRELMNLCGPRWDLAAIAPRHLAASASRAGYIRHKSEFLKMGVLKVSLLIEMLTAGFSVLMSDADVIWLDGGWRAWMMPPGRSERPIAEAALLHYADVLVSTDELDTEMDAADLTRGPGDSGWLGFGMRSELNTGVIFFRGESVRALAVAHAWRSRISVGIARGEPFHDQAYLLKLTQDAGLSSVSKRVSTWGSWTAELDADSTTVAPSQQDVTAVTRDVFRGEVGGSSQVGVDAMAPLRSVVPFTIGTLPAAQFVSGHYWFVQGGPEATATQQIQALHLTFGFGDGEEAPHGKRQRAREAGMWLMDDDSYFGHECAADGGGHQGERGGKGSPGMPSLCSGGGEVFLSLRSAAAFEPAERMRIELANPEWSPRRHLELMSLQLATLHRLLILSRAINATLVLPPLVCSCDRHWGLLRACRAPDAPPSMHLPFKCPMDHVFDVSHWVKSDSAVRFREHGFLRHARLSPSVRSQVVRLFSRPGASMAETGSAEARPTVGVPAGAPMGHLLPHVRAANPRVRLVEIGLSDLRALCPVLATEAATHAARSWAHDLLYGRGAASVAYCPAEENQAFPGWSRWNGKDPPLNCSRSYEHSRARGVLADGLPFDSKGDAACML